MSVAKENFVSRLKAYRSAVGSKALVEKDPSRKQHNQRAKMLRSGVSVVGFTTLEGFINDRSTEIISRVGGSEIPFDRLPRKMRRATTIGVARAISSQLRYLNDETDKVSFVQEHAQSIASTSGAGRYDLSSLALGASGSNMSHADVTKILSAFRVKNSWGQISKIAGRVGVGMPSLVDSFKSAKRRRHKGAHQADADIEPADLGYFYDQAMGIAIGFDALISHGLKYILDANKEFLNGDKFVDQEDFKIRFIDESRKGGWREVSEGKSRAYRVGEDFESVKEQALSRSRGRNEMLVVRDTSGKPRNWHIPFSA